MKKDKEYIDHHGYKISQMNGKDKRWRTVVRTDDGSLKTVSAKSKDELYIKLIQHYKSQTVNITFEEMFERFIETSKEFGKSGATIRRYHCDYKKFIQGTTFEKMQLKEITSEDVTKLLVGSRDKYNLTVQALKNLNSILKGVFRSAFINQIIDSDPCVYTDFQAIRKKCRRYAKPHETEDRILSDAEVAVLRTEIERFKNTEHYLKAYALELALSIGCRVGELTVLKRNDFDFKNGVLHIRHSEVIECRDNPTDSKYLYSYKSIDVGYTKDGRPRRIPITDDIRRIYTELVKKQKERGITSEYLFYDENREMYMTKTVLTDFVYKQGMKPFHSIRRTVASKLHLKGLSPKAVAALLGHSEMIDKKNYLYDSVDFDIKRKCLEDAFVDTQI